MCDTRASLRSSVSYYVIVGLLCVLSHGVLHDKRYFCQTASLARLQFRFITAVRRDLFTPTEP
jgi:hypothetical protein